MKLLIVTVVRQYHNEIIKLFKQSNINSFSESEIDGYKKSSSLLLASNWFPIDKSGVESSLFFSFSTDKKISKLFQLVSEFNNNLETDNPIRAVVVPVEKHI